MKHVETTWICVAAVVALVSSGCGNSPPGTTRRPCTSIANCTSGELCAESFCAACRTTDDCAAAPDYGEAFVCTRGNCERAGSCPTGTEGCPCLASGFCAPGLDCVSSSCIPACPVDQVRDVEGCRQAVGCEICDSRRRECLSENAGDGSAECGSCLAGHREVVGALACELIPTCNVGEEGSIAELCEAQGRSCLPTEGGAECGPCLASFVEVADTCEPRVTCSELDCASERRRCEEAPNGHCAGCLDYFVEEAGTCRAVLTCASAPCSTDEACLEATAVSDRSCVESIGGCPAWQVPHRDGVSCVACPVPCNELVGSSGHLVPTAFAGTQCVCETADGYFLSPGEDGGAVQTVACDADGDGWVRDTLLGLQKYRDANPTAAQLLLDNNRCTVRIASQMALRDEAGNVVSTQTLPEPVPLLESSRNDNDAELLALTPSDVDYLPPLGGTRPLLAAEINSLTKACLSVKADVNHNGVPDIKESQENTDASYLALLASESPVGVALKDHTYYLELYDGFFAPTTDALTEGWVVGGASLGGHSLGGAYVIQERSRARGASTATDAPGGVAMTYYTTADLEIETPPDNSAGNDHWRSCVRFRDVAYESRRLSSLPLHGLDFARFSTVPVVPDMIARADMLPSLGHASQFKCMVIDDGLVGDPQGGYIYSQAQTASFALNQCGATTVGTDTREAHGAENPSDPVLVCSTIDTVAQGWVGWGAVKYDEAGLDYERGCADEFAFFRAGCPGFSEETKNFITGDGDLGNFGNLLCGCAASYGGPACDYGCPDDNLFLHPDYTTRGAAALYPLVSRPYWLCAGSAASYMPGSPVFSTASGYTLEGDLPVTSAITSTGTGTLTTPSTPSGVYGLTGGFTVLRGSVHSN